MKSIKLERWQSEVAKRRYCVVCCNDNKFEFNKRCGKWECDNCGSVLSEGIVERDKTIEELRAKLDSYKNEAKEIKIVEPEVYTVYLQQKVEELERVILRIHAYSLQEAVDKATEMYNNGEIDPVDFESIGERDLTLVSSNEWVITKEDKQCQK